jgi:hypothetical protein
MDFTFNNPNNRSTNAENTTGTAETKPANADSDGAGAGTNAEKIANTRTGAAANQTDAGTGKRKTKGNTIADLGDDVTEISVTTSPENKPKQTRKPRKPKNNLAEVTANISTIMSITYAMVGNVILKAPEIWTISDDEANDIAEPLAKILDRMELTDKINKSSDVVTLCMALIAVNAPRIMMYKQLLMSQNNVIKKDGPKDDRKTGETKPNNNKSDDGRKPVEESTPDNQNNVNVLSALPAF